MGKGTYIDRSPLLIPGTRTWFDFADQATITSSANNVSSVRDKAGTIYSLSQGTTANQPRTGTRSQNGLNVLDFDGSNDFMQFNLNTAVSQPFTIFVVGQYDTSAAQQALIGRQTAAISGQWVMRKESGGVTFNSFLFTPAGSSSTARTGNLNPNIHCAYYQDGGSLNYSINNQSFGAGTARSGYDNAVATALVIGADNNSLSSPLDGWIGEVIIYGRVLTSDEILFINRYLSRKWGVALS